MAGTKIENLITCNVCFENVSPDKISTCKTCRDSGKSCHDCDVKWAKQNNNPEICTICKEKNRQNVSEESINIYNRSTLQNTTEISVTTDVESQHIRRYIVHVDSTDEISINDFNSCKKILCWLSIVLLFSWMFACFSFFIIFKIRKDFLKNIHIALGCGSVIAIPIVIIFRKYFKKNCLVDG
tara:strand:- start:39 stop:587 length:549 start_codon:yes stop_codon:yes gene_type:complete